MNVLVAVDQNALDAIDELRDAASDALEKYVEARRQIAELEAVAELRKAMGAHLKQIALVEHPIRELA